MNPKGGFVYIITNTHHTTLYFGVTSDLLTRIYEHKEKVYKTSFSAKYNLEKLVYFRFYDSIDEAIEIEKTIKKWRREKKMELIDLSNPDRRD